MTHIYEYHIYDTHIGRRAYTVQELHRIYVDTAREYYSAIEALLKYADTNLDEDKKHFQPMKQGYFGKDGKNTHAELETDSDGDGGPASLLRGSGLIEFSKKTIPHGSLHWPEMLRWAGHILMHCTGGPEASHRFNIKKAMDRVRKGSNEATFGSMIEWIYRIYTWGVIISAVQQPYIQAAATVKKKRKLARLNAAAKKRARLRKKNPKKKKLKKEKLVVTFIPNKLLKPNHQYIPGLLDDTFSPLRAGGDNFLSPDARVSYHEVRHMIHIYDSHI